MQFAKVLLPLAAPGYYTYAIPEKMQTEVLTGKRVVVHFGQGNRLYTGIITGTTNTPPNYKVKDLLEIIDQNPCLSGKSLELWQWISDYYMCTPGEVMSAALPGLLNISSESKFVLNKKSNISFDSLNLKERTVVNSLEQKGEIELNELTKITEIKNPFKMVHNLVNKEVILMREELKSSYKEKKMPWVGLSSSTVHRDKIDEIILTLNRAPKQLKLLMTLIELIEWDGESNGEKLIRKIELLTKSNLSDAVLKALLEKKILRLEMLAESRIDKNDFVLSSLTDLNKDQEKCFESINSLHLEKDVVLLHGVTSSGKTEIYARLIEEVISRDRQVLYLLPEISLTGQLINRLKQYFGNRITVYHSRLNQNERVEVWNRVSRNEKDGIQIVLGARSALFLPFTDLDLIVVDEEHDRSFKQQDPSPRYEARDSAIVLAKLHKAKVLLGSATPSIESIENAQTGKYGYVELKKRFGGFEMPEMKAVDLSEERRKRKIKGSLSSVLYNEINASLSLGEQIILFQNRRGYAPFIVCNNCTFTPKCKNCDVTLTHHKKRNLLMCHYCGYQISMMVHCPECNEGKLEDVGAGTEKIEEELKGYFPNAELARFDLDSTRKKNALQNLLDDFAEKKIDILIGTQMVTKGLDFENVGLVGIINADNMLKFPDFRAFERTFQMLTQVSGRAGRKKKRGKVIIQTYDPSHPVIQSVLSGDFNGFLKNELEERKIFRYPPFYRVLDVKLKHRDRNTLYEASRLFGLRLKSLFGEQLLGPEFPYIERIRNLYTMHFIIKISKNSSITSAKKKLASGIAAFTSEDEFKRIKILVDVDPY